VASNTHSNRTNAHYSNRSNAQRAAKRALGGEAVDGVDFRTYQTSDRRWAWHAKVKGGDTGRVKAEEKKADQALTSKSTKPRLMGKRAATEAAAREGKMPAPPDFSAATHAPYRKRLAEVVALAKAGDMKALADYPINPYSTSPKAIARYRDLCVLAFKVLGTRDLRKRGNVK
jgi:hypothetical protein